MVIKCKLESFIGYLLEQIPHGTWCIISSFEDTVRKKLMIIGQLLGLWLKDKVLREQSRTLVAQQYRIEQLESLSDSLREKTSNCKYWSVFGPMYAQSAKERYRNTRKLVKYMDNLRERLQKSNSRIQYLESVCNKLQNDLREKEKSCLKVHQPVSSQTPSTQEENDSQLSCSNTNDSSTAS